MYSPDTKSSAHNEVKFLVNREIGTIIRSLGCCPSEAELHDMLAEVKALICRITKMAVYPYISLHILIYI